MPAIHRREYDNRHCGAVSLRPEELRHLPICCRLYRAEHSLTPEAKSQPKRELTSSCFSRQHSARLLHSLVCQQQQPVRARKEVMRLSSLRHVFRTCRPLRRENDEGALLFKIEGGSRLDGCEHILGESNPRLCMRELASPVLDRQSALVSNSLVAADALVCERPSFCSAAPVSSSASCDWNLPAMCSPGEFFELPVSRSLIMNSGFTINNARTCRWSR